MAPRLELDVTYAARRPWAPRRSQFKTWAESALAGVSGASVLSVPRSSWAAVVIRHRCVDRLRQGELFEIATFADGAVRHGTLTRGFPRVAGELFGVTVSCVSRGHLRVLVELNDRIRRLAMAALRVGVRHV